MSRFQLTWAILMFIGHPRLDVDHRARGTEAVRWREHAHFPAASALWLYLVFLLMYLSPKLAG